MTEVPRKPARQGAGRFFLAVFRWTILLLVIPAGLLATAEGLLRLAGYGESRQPFLVRHGARETYYLPNLAYAAQFFSTPPFVEPMAYPQKKTDTTFRILVLGGSAAQGWPDVRFAFHGLLRLQLQAAYPGIDFQIINAAQAGLNLHAMRPIVRAAAPLDIDLVLVYAGNNEFQGPFGVQTYYRTGRIPSAGAVQRMLVLQRLRIVQYLQRALPKQEEPAPLREVDTRDVDRAINANFQDNLRAIAEDAQAIGAVPVFCTVPVNMRHWPPMQSFGKRPLTPEESAEWNRITGRGKNAQDGGRWAEAASAYREALALDTQDAEVHYRLAQCLLQLGAQEEARSHFEQAVELEESPFARCRPSQNALIREVAKETGALLSDVVQRLAGSAPSGIPGMEHFYDSCHPSFEGIHAIAGALFEALAPALPPHVQRYAGGGALLGISEARDLMAYDPAMAIAHFERLLANPEALPGGAAPFLETALQRLRADGAAPPHGPGQLEALQAARAKYGPCPQLLFSLLGIQVELEAFSDAVETATHLLATAPLRPQYLALAVQALRGANRHEEAEALIAETEAIFGRPGQTLVYQPPADAGETPAP